jgi:hypothetical protein
LRDSLKAKDFPVEVKLAYVPVDGFVPIGDADFELNLAALAAFEALDDVDSVEHNIDMTGDD